MAHARQQILAAIKAKLDAVASPLWRSTHVSPHLPPKASLPCLLLYHTGGGSSDAGLIGVRREERDMQVVVKAVMSYPANPADIPVKLDLIASQIETALTLAALQSTVEDMEYLGDEPDYEPDEVTGTVSIDLNWHMRYATLEGRPDTLGTD